MAGPSETVAVMNKDGTEFIDPARAPAGGYKMLNVDLSTLRSDVALITSTEIIRWVMVYYYDGAASAVATPDQYIRIGTNTDDKIPLFTLVREDSVVVFEGRVSGDIYLTNTAQSGLRLLLMVGIE